MQTLRITVYGLNGIEARELEELLWSIKEVHDVGARLDGYDLEPGVFHASSPHVEFVVEFLYRAGAEIAEAVAKEVLKDLYAAAKKRVEARLDKWRKEKEEEIGRARIQFKFDGDDQFVIPDDPR